MNRPPRPNVSQPVGALTAVVTLAVLATGALILALHMVNGHAALIERSYAGVIGVLGLLLTRRAVRSVTAVRLPGRRLGESMQDRETEYLQAPELDLEEAIVLGTSSLGAFLRLVRPRLEAVALPVLARHGLTPADRQRCEELLGPAFQLIDPALETPDIVAPGVPARAITQFLDALESLR